MNYLRQGIKKVFVADFIFFNVKMTSVKSITSFWEKEHFGKLFIRLFLGLFLVALGVRHFSGGLSALRTLGAIFDVIGITFWPGFLGTCSAIILILSGMCFLIGFFYRLNCGLLLLIFFLKAVISWRLADHFFNTEFLFNALIALLLFSLLFIGAGRFSSDGK
jgi:uncharacterized membrane protein YphA (DoxX/SURF4 family)